MTNQEKLKSKILEYLVRFYGEDNKEIIKEKISNIEIVFYNPIDTRNAYKQVSLLNLRTNNLPKKESLKKGKISTFFNVKKTNDKFIAVPLIFFHQNFNRDYNDVLFMHEIIHAVELSLIKFENGNTVFKCGFEYSSSFDEKNNKKYEFFNEIISHKIAVEITELMHREGFYIFDNKEKSRTRSFVLHEYYNFLIEEFYFTYKKLILRSRLGENLEELTNVINSINFNELNDLITKVSNISIFNFKRMLNDFKGNKITLNTFRLKKYIKEIKRINDAMDEYSKNILDNNSKFSIK